MRMQRCPTGHFYDADNFPECPHCERLKAEVNWKNAMQEDISSEFEIGQEVSVQQPMQQEITVSYHQNKENKMKPEDSLSDVEIQSENTSTVLLEDQEPQKPASENVAENLALNDQKEESSVSRLVNEKIDGNDTPLAKNEMFIHKNAEPISHEEEQISPEAVQSNSSSEKTFRILQSETGKDPTVGWLVVLNGEHYGEDFRLRSDKNYIGRNEDMDVALTGEKSVSRNKHVIISFEPRKQVFFAQPGESRKLFYLNEEVVLAPVFLKRNDILTIGEVELMFIPLCDEKFTWKKERK